MDFSPLRVLRCKSLAQSSNDYGVVALQQIGRSTSASGQTRTSSLGAARPLPPSGDIGPGG
jgi:hypothetical protein